MWDNPALFVAPILGAGLLLATVLAGSRGVGTTPPDQPVESEPELPAGARRPALVINPSKFDDPQEAVETIRRQCRALGWQEPLVIETTKDDPGVSQAQQAIEAGVDLVMACGGDGTVRAVGQAVAGSDITMGLLPAGTGNLLARNLNLPLDNLTEAVEVALGGHSKAIDVGWFRPDSKEPQAFLVMAGVGFDAEIMADAPEDLKSKVGPAAYVLSGLRKLDGHREKVRLRLDDDQPFTRRVRSVIIGNCGKLQAGIELMPDARIDDGRLDVLVLSPAGVVGWAAVAGAIATRSRAGHRIVEHLQGTRLALHTADPLSAQLDGDPIGKVRSAHVWVEQGALTLRVADEESADGAQQSGLPGRVGVRAINKALRSAVAPR